MSDKKQPPRVHHVPDRPVHVNNDRNLPPVTNTLPMPKVKPPKKD